MAKKGFEIPYRNTIIAILLTILGISVYKIFDIGVIEWLSTFGFDVLTSWMLIALITFILLIFALGVSFPKIRKAIKKRLIG
jgi:hypothetical protein